VSGFGGDFWRALEATLPTGDDWRVRPPMPEVCTRFLASLSASGERRFLIPLQPEEESLEDTRSRGLSVRTLEMVEEGGVAGRFLVVECREVGGYELFDLVGEELATVVAVQPPATAVTRVLAKWRRFWGQVPRSLLSRQEQIGLFGEIWFLYHWLLPLTTAGVATQRWRGPFGARNDFEWPNRAVEVKASTVVRGPVFRIGSLDQLDPPTTGELFLFTLRLREEASAIFTLPTLIADCRAAVEGDGDALGRYETALIQAGYSPAHDADYAQIRWRIIGEKLYPVSEDFPRINAASFAGELPPGISEISYTLDLGGYRGLSYENCAAAGSSLI